jgi:hypothetical protein
LDAWKYEEEYKSKVLYVTIKKREQFKENTELVIRRV